MRSSPGSKGVLLALPLLLLGEVACLDVRGLDSIAGGNVGGGGEPDGDGSQPFSAPDAAPASRPPRVAVDAGLAVRDSATDGTEPGPTPGPSDARLAPDADTSPDAGAANAVGLAHGLLLYLPFEDPAGPRTSAIDRGWRSRCVCAIATRTPRGFRARSAARWICTARDRRAGSSRC